MSARRQSGSRALFLELVLDLVIFAICATVCLQVFAAARLASENSAAYSTLGIEAQSLAEDFAATGGDVTALAQHFGAQRNGSTLTLYYDRDCQPVSQASAVYTLTCAIDASQPVRTAEIVLERGDTRILELSCAKFVQQGRAQ
ncbi:MAG: hypothetical protein LBR39_05825 [Coriobacteriales bacterium]|jgi:Tfp pilus assembly protein PilE|nr:hypothetical protein [Coriobacteriales bacterium]